MTYEEKKTAKIVEELMMFFFSMGAVNIESGIERKQGGTFITFKADYNPKLKEKLIYLNNLKGNRNDGMEDIYWELAGSGDPGETNELLLLGMMIDDAEIVVEPEYVRLKLYKEATG